MVRRRVALDGALGTNGARGCVGCKRQFGACRTVFGVPSGSMLPRLRGLASIELGRRPLGGLFSSS